MIAECPTLTVPALTPEDIARSVRHVPSAPKVLPRLKQMLSDGNSAIHEIVMLIRLDVGISARVLQVANSAYYSQGTRCYTVEEAVARVGYDEVYDLVAYAVASQVLVRPLAAYGIEADELWRQSVACALAAETIALYTGQDRNVAYTNGLLHAVGLVAVDEWARRNPHSWTLVNEGFPRETVESERAALGFTNAEAGAALLRMWDFPREMSEPVRWQYAPNASGGHLRMACLLHAAKWLRSTVCAGGRRLPAQLEEAQLMALPLSPKLLAGMAFMVETRLAEISSLLDVEDSPRLDLKRLSEVD
jgi:HD-like signal output (HDOD) protein